MLHGKVVPVYLFNCFPRYCIWNLFRQQQKWIYIFHEYMCICCNGNIRMPLLKMVILFSEHQKSTASANSALIAKIVPPIWYAWSRNCCKKISKVPVTQQGLCGSLVPPMVWSALRTAPMDGASGSVGVQLTTHLCEIHIWLQHSTAGLWQAARQGSSSSSSSSFLGLTDANQTSTYTQMQWNIGLKVLNINIETVKMKCNNTIQTTSKYP